MNKQNVYLLSPLLIPCLFLRYLSWRWTLSFMANWSLLRSTFYCIMSSRHMDQIFMVIYMGTHHFFLFCGKWPAIINIILRVVRFPRMFWKLWSFVVSSCFMHACIKAALLLLDTRWHTIINTYHIKPLWSELLGWLQMQWLFDLWACVPTIFIQGFICHSKFYDHLLCGCSILSNSCNNCIVMMIVFFVCLLCCLIFRYRALAFLLCKWDPEL